MIKLYRDIQAVISKILSRTYACVFSRCCCWHLLAQLEHRSKCRCVKSVKSLLADAPDSPTPPTYSTQTASVSTGAFTREQARRLRNLCMKRLCCSFSLCANSFWTFVWFTTTFMWTTQRREASRQSAHIIELVHSAVSVHERLLIGRTPEHQNAAGMQRSRTVKDNSLAWHAMQADTRCACCS